MMAMQRTGPQNTPSAINTCFGWVLFGKIKGSDVVDITNLTLEQEVSRELTESRRSYAAVLIADKNRDLRPMTKEQMNGCRTTTIYFET